MLNRSLRQTRPAFRHSGINAKSSRLAPLLGFTGHARAAGPLIGLLYADTGGAQVAAAQALLYLDKGTVKKSLLDSLRTRGPRDRMIHLLVVPLQAKADEVTPLLVRWLEDKDGAARYAAVSGIALSNGGKAPELLPLLEQRLEDCPCQGSATRGGGDRRLPKCRRPECPEGRRP
jgi:hypothetical protein